ncbi:hypothetical protein [Marinoscillum sp. MHG1-6]|uniref:hypothetical protein n=1 Tax=Marinoscillum sp. MHG1-6 TaxID=2959627 RepID=UPI0021570DA9|nr:hypothetical protein [Marinoscillum sp. MHG1-6]
MRHTFKTLAAILTVLVNVAAFAKTDSADATFFKVVAQKNEYAFKVIYKGLEKSVVNVQWTNEYNEVVYKETLNSIEGFVKQYDLSSLPDGEYKVTLKTKDLEFSELVETGDLSDFNFSLKGQSGKNVVLTGRHPQGKDVTVVILDEKRDVIYSSSLKDTQAVSKKYNFEKIDTDAVTFVLYHNDKLLKEESIAF